MASGRQVTSVSPMAMQSPRGRRGAEPAPWPVAATYQGLPSRGADTAKARPEPLERDGLNFTDFSAGANGPDIAAAHSDEERCACHGMPRGILCGQHRMVTNDNDVFTGMFQDGQLLGGGTWQSKVNGNYEGEWKDGLFDGKGVFNFSSGERFEGNFKAGCPLNGVLISNQGHVLQVTFSGLQGILEADLFPTDSQQLESRSWSAESEDSINLFGPTPPKTKGAQVTPGDGSYGPSVLPANLVALLVRTEQPAADKPDPANAAVSPMARELSQASTVAASRLWQVSGGACCTCHGISRSLLSGWHLVHEPDEGATFEGDWQQGVRCGHGIWKSPGGSFEGEWDMNYFCGEGTFWFAEGDIFQGTFADGNPLRGILRKTTGRQLHVTFPGTLGILDPNLEPLSVSAISPTNDRSSSPVGGAAGRGGPGVSPPAVGSEFSAAYSGMSIPYGPPEISAQVLSPLVCQCHGAASSTLHGKHIVTVFAPDGSELMNYTGAYRNGCREGTGVWQGGDNGYSGSWANGFMSGEGEFSWKTAGHTFRGLFRLGCPVTGIITTASGRMLSVTFRGNVPILSPGLVPETHVAIDTDISTVAGPQAPLPLVRTSRVKLNGVEIDTSQPHSKDVRLSQIKKKPKTQEHRCKCHNRPVPLLQGDHEVWYSPTIVFRGSWLDGNWHGKGQVRERKRARERERVRVFVSVRRCICMATDMVDGSDAYDYEHKHIILIILVILPSVHT
jgi:hypothetical protein